MCATGTLIRTNLQFGSKLTVCGGVDVVGPSNLVTMMKSIPSYWAPFYTALIKTIGGDPDTAEGRLYLASISPVNFVKKNKKTVADRARRSRPAGEAGRV